MTLEIGFELEDVDLERFQTLFREAREKTAKMEPQALARAARKLVQSGLASNPPDFVRPRLEGLGQLAEMVEDTAWDSVRQRHRVGRHRSPLGRLQSEAEKHAARLVAENTEGVREIEDHLGVIPPQVRSVLWAE